MKIGIFSDTHFGFAEGSERGHESFANARAALELCLSHGVDALLLPGDVFDSPIPSQETWREAFAAFSPLKKVPASVSAVHVKQGVEQELELSHVPLIGIHGNHEFRGKRFAGTLDVLEKAGLLVQVHAAHVLLTKGKEQVAVHGMGGVPEKKARDALRVYAPQPVPECKNILLLHQSYTELLPFDDEMIATLSFSDLPKGFDLIVNGHFHELFEQDVHGTTFLIPGSTLITQMKQSEADNPKVVCILDTETMGYEKVPIPGQRKLLFQKLEFADAHPDAVCARVTETLQNLLSPSFSEKPLVKLRLKGTLAKGVSPGDILLSPALEQFREKAVIAVSRSFSADSFKKKVSELREQQRERKSVAALGLSLLEKNLAETSFDVSRDVRELFSLLEAGKIDEAAELVAGAN